LRERGVDVNIEAVVSKPLGKPGDPLSDDALLAADAWRGGLNVSRQRRPLFSSLTSIFFTTLKNAHQSSRLIVPVYSRSVLAKPDTMTVRRIITRIDARAGRLDWKVQRPE